MKERPILMNAAMVRAILDGRKTQTRRPIYPQPTSVEISETWHEIAPGSVETISGSTHPFPGSRPAHWFRFGSEMNARIDHTRQHSSPYKQTRSSVRRAEKRDSLVERKWAWQEVASACPYGQPGDRLWVRETWMEGHEDGGGGHGKPYYRASWGNVPADLKWRPSIHMPRWASRITMEITDVRVQRIQGITGEEAKAEGLRGITKDGVAVKWGIPDADGLPGEDDFGWRWHKWELDPREAYRKVWASIYEKPRAFNWSANPGCGSSNSGGSRHDNHRNHHCHGSARRGRHLGAYMVAVAVGTLAGVVLIVIMACMGMSSREDERWGDK